MRGRDPIQRAGLFRSVKLRFVAAQRLPRKPEAGTGSLPWPTVLVPIVIATLLCVYLFPLFSRSGETCCRPLPSVDLIALPMDIVFFNSSLFCRMSRRRL